MRSPIGIVSGPRCRRQIGSQAAANWEPQLGRLGAPADQMILILDLSRRYGLLERFEVIVRQSCTSSGSRTHRSPKIAAALKAACVGSTT